MLPSIKPIKPTLSLTPSPFYSVQGSFFILGREGKKVSKEMRETCPLGHKQTTDNYYWVDGAHVEGDTYKNNTFYGRFTAMMRLCETCGIIFVPIKALPKL